MCVWGGWAIADSIAPIAYPQPTPISGSYFKIMNHATTVCNFLYFLYLFLNSNGFNSSVTCPCESLGAARPTLGIHSH